MDRMCSLQKAAASELDTVYALIDARIRWMDEQGVRNVCDYWSVYPKAYYEQAVRERRLHVLRVSGSEEIVGAVVVSERDPLWTDDAPALYLHNLVTKIGERGAGNAMLSALELIAKLRGKQFLRLDCAKENEKLNAYYEKRGFALVDSFEDGALCGSRRERPVTDGCHCGG